MGKGGGAEREIEARQSKGLREKKRKRVREGKKEGESKKE